MTDSIVPVTYIDTTHSAVLASPAIGKGHIEVEQTQRTVYPNGLSVTNIYHHTVEVYDNRGFLTSHNHAHLIDMIT